jgi:hypothetical protein
MAMLVTLLSILLMAALGAALVLTTMSESLVAGHFRAAAAGRYAAAAALDQAMDDLAIFADWTPALSGLVQSSFVDGPPAGPRTMDDGSTIDLEALRNTVNCGKATVCSATDLTASTSRRPWGANNPNWHVFAYGRLKDLLPAGTIESREYVVVFIADDPAETDGDPLRDGDTETNPGAGVVRLRGEAFGPRGVRQAVEATVARSAETASGVRLISWRARQGG